MVNSKLLNGQFFVSFVFIVFIELTIIFNNS